MGMFRLTIETGNDAMETGAQVAEALRKVAKRMGIDGATDGAIVDDNGNTVGYYELTPEEEE